jgi:hypothetical protein
VYGGLGIGTERIFSPNYFRKRAEEYRTKADNAEHHQTKERLRKVARNTN